jgi:nitrogen regulatory protein PII
MAQDMWMVQAVIQPFKLDAVTLALEELPGFGGITVTDCRGFGKEKLADLEEAAPGEDPQQRRRRSDASLVDFTAKLRLEIAVAGRDQADAIVETISKSAHTGRRGDGKIFVWPIARAVRVRTFEEGDRAL